MTFVKKCDILYSIVYSQKQTKLLILLRKGLIIFFFFFFFGENILNEPIIQKAFDIVCGQKLAIDGYCDMSEYILGASRKNDYYRELVSINSIFADLYEYRTPIPKSDMAYEKWNEFVNSKKGEYPELIENSAEDMRLSYIEAKALINWIYQTYSKKDEREEKTKQLFSYIETEYSIEDLDFQNEIVFVKSKVELNFIDSVEEYIQELNSLKNTSQLFYRGHSNINYILSPSIMRKQDWIDHEHDMYNEAIIECSSVFESCKTHLDYLVLMQHYGLPTRLLDITKNPLVALYFACLGNGKQNGEVIVLSPTNNKIKYPNSDTVSILSSISILDNATKNELIRWATTHNASANSPCKDKLIHEIQNEKPAFIDRINKKDLLDCFFVLASKRNSRIINQDGAFIICGLIGNSSTAINKYRYSENNLTRIYIIKDKDKPLILKTLDKLSINQAHLFPEFEDVSEYIKNKY